MTALTNILQSYRSAALSEREKGTYFEELIACYLRHEASYQDLYSDVWTWSDWAEMQGLDKRDTGIDLVAKTRGTDEFHAIQCKFYSEFHSIQKADIDSFFTASGKKPFKHRIIVATTTHWSDLAKAALADQQPPVSKIDLLDLEHSQIDWLRYAPKQVPVLKEKKSLRPHQVTAHGAVLAGLGTADRGKLIMACGTGKTFVSLKIAESVAGPGKRVLFLVPSLSLLSQTLTEWTQETGTPLHSFAVCSDSDVGNKRKKVEDTVTTFAHELRYPATTEPLRLAQELAKRHDAHHMSVVFSTYHSIEVVSAAQHKYGLADFDLVVCDEAHRTTGYTFDDDEESAFVRVHDAAFLRASKRLYMTATPRIFADTTKIVAERDNIALCSMDDVALYGEQLHVLTFSDAVKADLLVDYKVLVLAVDEAHVSRRLQNLWKDGDSQLKVEDAGKIIGCWKALSKQDIAEQLAGDERPMQRAVAFCQIIEYQPNAKAHKVSSKNIAGIFNAVVEEYKLRNADDDAELAATLECEAKHVDGGMNASQKEEKLAWLKAEVPADTCRILSNVRCLSEGVDVPALDAVLFLTPRNSQIDVVQSVGRVMRKAPGKARGYVVLPIVIPAGMAAEEALNDNKTYRVVWQVLQALRSHDDRFDALVNKLDLIGRDTSRMEVIAVTDKVQRKASADAGSGAGRGTDTIGKPAQKTAAPDKSQPLPLNFGIGELERAIYAKVVQKCGNRRHWEEWANDIARIAQTHITRIRTILDDEANTKERAAFGAFANELRDDLNDSITDGEVIEMLAQHLITKPVFDALFADYSFASHNPISLAMQGVLDVLHEHRLENEADTLQRFYDSVKLRAQGIDNAVGKQKIVVELYDKFFRNAFPKMTERLGIVYTPVEIVDFIIHSVDHVLREEFGQTLGSDGVHILDPFTGTGTFITRLMQSGLLTKEELRRKYVGGEIHANEIVLLAYYIAAVNIEAVYHSVVGGEYVPFEGIYLTDTFQLYEKEDMVSALLVDNSARRVKQKKLDIRVIVGNPPYSEGQRSENDNNQNVVYRNLDATIRRTYAARSTAGLLKGLFNSYVRAIRWATDRIGDSGVVGFVSGSGFIEKPAMDGVRKALAEDFSSLHVINLRGDIRKNMLSKGAAREGQNVFGSSSMAGIVVTLFVKSPSAARSGVIHYYDIGDDQTQESKLNQLRAAGNIAALGRSIGCREISPDAHGDWLGQRDDAVQKFLALGNKKGNDAAALFENYTLGVVTNRDAWCYNASARLVVSNMRRMIAFYNTEAQRYRSVVAGKGGLATVDLDSFIDADPKSISWTRALKQDLTKGRTFEFESQSLVCSLYRPFTKQSMYFSRRFNEMVYQMPRIFPDAAASNRVLYVSGTGARAGFSALITDCLPNLHMLDTGQGFPRYLYDEAASPAPGNGSQAMLFAPPTTPTHTRRDAITDAGLAHFAAAYPTAPTPITKDDLFYYVYGLLHSPDYRTRYADNLSKELPRIPAVRTYTDFQHFTQAGRDLAHWHLNYETIAMHPCTIDTGGRDLATLTDADYRVVKMKYGKDKDKTTLHYNAHITVRNIPLAAYEYVVNGKSALDWVVERQCVKTDKDSGIVNDANDWAIETMGNAKYPLELFLRVITVSLETMKIVAALPPLDI